MKSKIKAYLWRWVLRTARNLVWRADEWIHAQEVKLQSPARITEPVVLDPVYNRAQSAARERKIRKSRAPRLRYVAGEFVREDAAQ